MSWNVHGCVGADWRCDTGRVLDVIARLAPDILALQEIDGRAHLGRRPCAFETFAAALGGHIVEARTVPRPDRDYGHLLWSRWPLSARDVRRLPGGRFEPRMAIDAVCATPAGPWRLLATHLGLLPRDRRRQAEALAGAVAAGPHPTIALGDFNEWRRSGGVDRRLCVPLPVRLAAASWPARWPVVAMDRLYASAELSGLRLADIEEKLSADTARASDHLPLVADILTG